MSAQEIAKQIYEYKKTVQSNNRRINETQKKLDKLKESKKLIEKVYDEHCRIFKSVKLKQLCDGCNISLVSAGELGRQATLQLKGRNEANCSKEYEDEITETSNQIKRCEKIIEDCQKSIDSANANISRLNQCLVRGG